MLHVVSPRGSTSVTVLCCVPSHTVDLDSLSMTVTDVSALIKEQIASFNADANSLEAALAVLTGAAGLENMVRCTQTRDETPLLYISLS